VLPLFSIPVYLVGQGLADSLDRDDTNGVLALGLILGVVLPALGSMVLAHAGGALGQLASIGLGIVSGFLSLVTFLVHCSATRCVV
jgi:hypothetical protein